jgi:Zn-finger nucleic acid-binding protein
MLGHLKAADFVNLIEGAELPAKHKAHIDGCPRCRGTWESMRTVHAEITSMDTDIPEPDWTQFRSSVRDELLSRSIQRESAVRRWTGWAIRPAVAWALSMLMAIGVTTVTVLWKIDGRAPAPTPAGVEPAIPIEPAAEVIESGPEKSLFDDVVSLGEEEQEQLRQMLESAQKGVSYPK